MSVSENYRHSIPQYNNVVRLLFAVFAFYMVPAAKPQVLDIVIQPLPEKYPMSMLCIHI